MKPMPVLFVGHGSPMNIIADNGFTQALAQLGQSLPLPKAVLSISAHWLTEGSQIVTSSPPPTIYDFHGFPEELYQISYPAPGAVDLAQQLIKDFKTDMAPAPHWGLDHGTWSVLLHMYPKAQIPVTQLSLNSKWTAGQHLAFARRLKYLRNEGVLILASGNLVHNLRKIQWNIQAPPHAWATEFDEFMKTSLERKDLDALINPHHKNAALFELAHPSVEHYLPLFYFLGAMDPSDQISFPYEGIQNASISMRAALSTI